MNMLLLLILLQPSEPVYFCKVTGTRQPEGNLIYIVRAGVKDGDTVVSASVISMRDSMDKSIDDCKKWFKTKKRGKK